MNKKTLHIAGVLGIILSITLIGVGAIAVNSSGLIASGVVGFVLSPLIKSLAD
jgi:hypothetical protein